MGLRKRTLLNEYHCFFVTTTCNNWLEIFLNDNYFNILYESLIFLNKKYLANIVGYVFMKNHVHLIIYFDDKNYLSAYMRDFKKYTSGEIRRLLEKDGHIFLLNKLRYERDGQKFKIWMDRFDDVIIKSSKILFTKLQYIHNNPVRKGYANNPEEYKHSSANYYLKNVNSMMPILHCNDII